MSEMAKTTGRGRNARPRRKYDDLYKAEAVRMVLEGGKAVRQVARELGIVPSGLDRWVKLEEQRRGLRMPVPGPVVPLSIDERDELQRLRKRVRELEMDKAILKKAAAFFAKENA